MKTTVMIAAALLLLCAKGAVAWCDRDDEPDSHSGFCYDPDTGTFYNKLGEDIR